MTLFADNMTITRITTKRKYYNQKKKKTVLYKKPVVERELVCTAEPYDLEGLMKEIFFNCDKEYEKGWNGDVNVELEVKVNVRKEIW